MRLGSLEQQVAGAAPIPCAVRQHVVHHALAAVGSMALTFTPWRSPKPHLLRPNCS